MVSKKAGIVGRRVYFALLGEIFELHIVGKLDRTDREKCGKGGAEERGDFCLR